MPEHRLAGERGEKLVKTHAAAAAGGDDDGGNHEVSVGYLSWAATAALRALPSARPGGAFGGQFHHRAHLGLGSGARLGDRRRDQRGHLLRRQRLGQIRGQDFRLGFLLGGEFRPVALFEALDGILALLQFLAHHRQRAGVIEHDSPCRPFRSRRFSGRLLSMRITPRRSACRAFIASFRSWSIWAWKLMGAEA